MEKPRFQHTNPQNRRRSREAATLRRKVRLSVWEISRLSRRRLVANRASSERIAANSKTRERYESEITIAIHARGREAGNTDLMPIAAAIEVMARRTKSFLVSLLIVDFTIAPEWLPSSSADPLATKSPSQLPAQTKCLCLRHDNKAYSPHHLR